MSRVERLPSRMATKIRIENATDLVSGECWLWTGCLTSAGYGCIGIDGKRLSTHRVAYQALVGPIPTGLQLDHLCRVRRCCNPRHLEAVTGKVNSERAITANKAVCVNGHALVGDNVRIKTRGADRTPVRNCVKCQIAAQRRYRANRKAAAA